MNEIRLALGFWFHGTFFMLSERMDMDGEQESKKQAEGEESKIFFFLV
jgi:hypothetical protein